MNCKQYVETKQVTPLLYIIRTIYPTLDKNLKKEDPNSKNTGH